MYNVIYVYAKFEEFSLSVLKRIPADDDVHVILFLYVSRNFIFIKRNKNKFTKLLYFTMANTDYV